MTEGRGRDALFGPPLAPATNRSGGQGRLWSGPPRRKGTVIVECGHCQARTPVALVPWGPCLLASIWIPRRAFPRLLLCPACRTVAWCRVHWRTLLD